jgi:hypothetical protein
MIYIASSLTNAARVKAVGNRFRALGYEITYDWTSHNGGIPYVGDSQPSIKADVAHLELDGVRRARAVLVIMPGGRGTYFEFGAAYALGKPIILLLDQHSGNSPSFNFLSGVVHSYSEDEAIAITIDFIEGRCQASGGDEEQRQRQSGLNRVNSNS